MNRRRFLAGLAATAGGLLVPSWLAPRGRSMVALSNTDWLCRDLPPITVDDWHEHILTTNFKGDLTFTVNYAPRSSPWRKLGEERKLRLVFPDGTSWEGRGRLTAWEVNPGLDGDQATLRFQL